MAEKITILAHNARFHPDDVFAVAALRELLGDETEIIRSREPEIIEKATYVVDVGGIHDPALNRFDHHQAGGAGKRENGIPYASFGLVWNEFGEKLAGGSKAAHIVDRRLVQSIDAMDNGVDLYTPKIENVHPYLVQSMVIAFNPTWKEDDSNVDQHFLQMVEFARAVLRREIKKAQDDAEMIPLLEKAYADAADKRIIILNQPMAWDNVDVLSKYPEPLYVVRPNRQDPHWKAEGVRNSIYTYQTRKKFPESWGGKRHEELDQATGVPGGVFCHNARFLVVAKTKETALELAKMAVNA